MPTTCSTRQLGLQRRCTRAGWMRVQGKSRAARKWAVRQVPRRGHSQEFSFVTGKTPKRNGARYTTCRGTSLRIQSRSTPTFAHASTTESTFASGNPIEQEPPGIVIIGGSSGTIRGSPTSASLIPAAWRFESGVSTDRKCPRSSARPAPSSSANSERRTRSDRPDRARSTAHGGPARLAPFPRTSLSIRAWPCHVSLDTSPALMSPHLRDGTARRDTEHASGSGDRDETGHQNVIRDTQDSAQVGGALQHPCHQTGTEASAPT